MPIVNSPASVERLLRRHAAARPVRHVRHGVLTVALLVLTACASNYEAPIVQKPALPSAARPAAPGGSRVLNNVSPDRDQPTPAVHKVASGDKLLTIAWRYGLDVRDLVRWNQITNPDLIVVGQNLRLRPPAPPAPPVAARLPSAAGANSGSARSALSVPAPDSKPAPRISVAPITAGAPAPTATTPSASAPAVPQARTAAAPTESSKPMIDDGSSKLAANKAGVRWMWPAQGKVSAADAGSVTKGIDIRGTRGQPVKASAGGTVVYSGSGLRGYGELIIVQHNDTFLSAYAHNEARLVQEGRHVAAGETIARMGNSDTTDVMLHFEIRRNGKAVDPLQYLPNR
jgi:lipoprotein NlpD